MKKIKNNIVEKTYLRKTLVKKPVLLVTLLTALDAVKLVKNPKKETIIVVSAKKLLKV